MLAEDFCERVLGGHYDSVQHRAAVEQGFVQMGLEPMVNDLIFRLEKEMPLNNRPYPATDSRPNSPAASSSPRSVSQMASAALSSIQPVPPHSEEHGRTLDLRPSEPAWPQEKKPDNDSFKYNRLDGLSIEELMKEDADSVPFSVGG